MSYAYYNEYMNKIDGRYLRQMREERGLSLRAFADMVYASKSSVQRWEQSSVPENEDILNAISEVFNLSVEEMRAQSEKRFGEIREDDYTPEQLAEMKFGVKWLAVALCGVVGFVGLALTAGIVALILI